jgi:hypothetical protein
MNHCGGTNPSRREHTTRKVLLSWFDVRAMTMRGGTQSRWRFKRPAATHDLLIHFVRRADRLEYYDCAALSSAGRSLRKLSTALKICWTLSAPSTRISGKILHGAYRRAGPHVQCARSCARQCRTRCKCAPTTDRRTFVLSPRGRRWLIYSFSARARVYQFQRVSEPSGFCSKAFRASLFQSAARPAVKCIRGSPRMHG